MAELELRVQYDNTGQKIEEAEIENDQYHGRYKSWWSNGNRKAEGRYYRGHKIGLYRWYSENGNLLKEEDYGPGVL